VFLPERINLKTNTGREKFTGNDGDAVQFLPMKNKKDNQHHDQYNQPLY
jgi:hypothetical protein